MPGPLKHNDRRCHGTDWHLSIINRLRPYAKANGIGAEYLFIYRGFLLENLVMSKIIPIFAPTNIYNYGSNSIE